MILVYTPVVKPRIRYIFKHFFGSRMGEELSFTSDLSAFIAHNGPKMSYGNTPLGNEFFIAAHGLLTEQGIQTIDLQVFDWEGLPAFFATQNKSALPFDFFAAAFYLMSRYEEYQPYVADALGRFGSSQSLASKHDFLHLPLVDLWFERFVSIWDAFFHTSHAQDSVSSVSLIVDVPQLFAYKYKSFFRSFAEGIQDFFQFRFASVFDRILVLLGVREDPLSNIHHWIEVLMQKIDSIHFFVLFTKLGIHDRSLSVFNVTHQQEIKSISDYAPTAPLASFESSLDESSLGVDISRFTDLIHRPITSIRQHKLMVQFPHTYRLFSSLGIKNDYSMQYADAPGFRASTAFPFRFYDLGDEQQTPLTIHPVCLSEAHIRNQRFSRKMRQLFLSYQERLDQIHAPFVVALTNESFNSRSKNAAFLSTLTKMLSHE
ncbi:MAG: hypothetical protein O2961_04825 [Bacteroidetes bacterium]|nr:hypothetical protein [Bacteroidota bacterium]